MVVRTELDSIITSYGIADESICDNCFEVSDGKRLAYTEVFRFSGRSVGQRCGYPSDPSD